MNAHDAGHAFPLKIAKIRSELQKLASKLIGDMSLYAARHLRLSLHECARPAYARGIDSAGSLAMQAMQANVCVMMSTTNDNEVNLFPRLFWRDSHFSLLG